MSIKFLKFIQDSKWVFTKTMPEIPHHYIVRDDLSVPNQKLFDEFKEFIDKKGYSKKFYEKEYKYIDMEGYKYWIIENILNREEIK